MDGHAHPRVNAALVMLVSNFFRLIRVRAFTWSNEIGLSEGLALGSHCRKAKQIIERLNDTAAELFDLGEGVDLAADVRRHVCVTFAEIKILRSKTPFRRAAES